MQVQREVFTKLDGASFDLHESSADEMGRAMSAVMSRSNLEALQWFALPTSQRSAESGRALVDPTPNGNPKDQTRGHKADGEKVRHGRGHYYDLYSICDTIGCRVPGRVRCALRLQFLDLRLPHSYSIVTLLFGLIVHIQLFA